MFEGWFEHILQEGSLWFQCSLKMPLGMDDYRARVVDIFEGSILAVHSFWRFTAKLELPKRSILDAEWIIDISMS